VITNAVKEFFNKWLTFSLSKAYHWRRWRKWTNWLLFVLL